MDALFARYFDGDLSEREAGEFLDAVESDPSREKELRQYERLLALGKSLPAPKTPAGFTDEVMSRIEAEERRGRSILRVPVIRMPGLRLRWTGLAVAAASLALAYAGGFWTARDRGRARQVPQANQVATRSSDGGAAGPTNVVAGSTDAGAELRYVRLVYVPADPSVGGVSVAGTFNDWDPTATPLRRQGAVWSTVLVLPASTYEYMFVEDGARWVTDPLAAETRDDGFGGANAILDVGA
jgi:anti-sigma factor RsiW